jgi:Zn-dependent peptidase ImmA (M78 family)/DNA-binding XRE family transcriptional regulator
MPNVNPKMVILARQSRGLTQIELALSAGMTQGTVSKIESGVITVNDDELMRLSNSLDYPNHFFEQQERVEAPGISELFHRKHQQATATTLNKAYALASIRKLEVKKLLRSWETKEYDFPKLPIDDFEGNPEKIARTVRALWQLPPGPIFSMTEVLENAGAIIFKMDFGTRHIAGFSIRSADMPPIFFMNKDMPPDRWRWTLAHEMAHVIMHFVPPSDDTNIEEQADHFAGEFLAPAREIKPQLWVISFSQLAGLKLYWKISIQSLIMRAYRLGTITERKRRDWFMQISKAGYRLREPTELDPPAEPPVLPRKIARYHLEQLGYSESQLRKAIAIGDEDFRTYYYNSDMGLRLVTQKG